MQELPACGIGCMSASRLFPGTKKVRFRLLAHTSPNDDRTEYSVLRTGCGRLRGFLLRIALHMLQQAVCPALGARSAYHLQFFLPFWHSVLEAYCLKHGQPGRQAGSIGIHTRALKKHFGALSQSSRLRHIARRPEKVALTKSYLRAKGTLGRLGGLLATSSPSN